MKEISFHRLTLLTMKLDFTLTGLKEISFTNPFLLPLLHHLRQQGRIQVLAYLTTFPEDIESLAYFGKRVRTDSHRPLPFDWHYHTFFHPTRGVATDLKPINRLSA